MGTLAFFSALGAKSLIGTPLGKTPVLELYGNAASQLKNGAGRVFELSKVLAKDQGSGVRAPTPAYRGNPLLRQIGEGYGQAAADAFANRTPLGRYAQALSAGKLRVIVRYRLAGAAKGFQNFECVECAESIADALAQKGVKGEYIDVYTKGKGGGRDQLLIWSDKAGMNISTNGFHRGVRVGNTVFDNHNPNGISYSQWIKDLYGPFGLEITSSPIK